MAHPGLVIVGIVTTIAGLIWPRADHATGDTGDDSGRAVDEHAVPTGTPTESGNPAPDTGEQVTDDTSSGEESDNEAGT